jgi:tetratricopeptide (TPR) repeat protein
MKKILLPLVAAFTYSLAFAQVQLPQLSPTVTVAQNFGLGQITLVYSRPSIKGRTLFMENSDLAPLGKMWRTGANAATRLTFTDRVNFGGKDLDTGSYVLYTIPGKTEWEIILNKGLTNGGTDGYKESEDVVRFKTPATNVSGMNIESFTMEFTNLKPESCDLSLLWGNTMVSIPITTKIKDRVRAQIENALQGNDKPYWQAANFYYTYDRDYKKALENVNHAIETNQDAYYMYMMKARIQKELGDKTAAKASAEKCIQLATAAKNDDYVKQGNEFLKTL